MNRGIPIVLSALVLAVYCAPTEIKDEQKRRETTKETLELEGALKRLAGEDKQHFTANGAHPIPQVDGLEDKHQTKSLADQTKPQPQPAQQLEDNNDDDVESNSLQETNDAVVDDAEPVSKEIEGDSTNEVENPESALDSDNQNEVEDGNRAYYPDQDDVVSNYALYKDYPYPSNVGNLAAEKEEYALQDVLAMMEQHPQLLSQIMQAKSALDGDLDNEKDEDDVADAYDHMRESNLDLQQLASNYLKSAPSSQQQSLYDSEEEALENTKALQQQYEKLQQLYGDTDAHIVAKKKGYGPVHVQSATATDEKAGSGEISPSHLTNDSQEEQLEKERQRHLESELEKEDKSQVFEMPLM